MPLAKTESDKLTREDLVAGIMETQYDSGASELFSQLPFVGFKGSTHSFNVEYEIGTGNSALDPYNTDGNIKKSGGKNDRFNIEAKALARNADTAKIDVQGKDNINNPRTNDIQKQAKKLAQDFFRQVINGRTAGDHTSFNNVKGLEEWFAEYSGSNYDHVDHVIYNTDDGTATGNPEELSLTALDKLIIRAKDEPYDALYVNRDTHTHIKGLLNASSGNTAEMLMLDTFGKPVLTYDGIPIIWNEAVGISRSWDAADVFGSGNAGANEVVVTDEEFFGFHPKDVGKDFTHNTNTYTVNSVVASDTVTVNSAGSGSTGNSGSIGSQNVIYGVRYGERDGIYAPYFPNVGVSADTGEYFDGVVGFNAQNIGLLEDGETLRTRMSWYGTIACNDPYAIGRLSHFDVA